MRIRAVGGAAWEGRAGPTRADIMCGDGTVAIERCKGAHMAGRALSDSLRSQTVLVTGGAGFVGAHLACALAREGSDARIIAVDNLRRRGSELNLPRLAEHGVEFVHGDVRNADD